MPGGSANDASNGMLCTQVYGLRCTFSSRVGKSRFPFLAVQAGEVRTLLFFLPGLLGDAHG